MNISKFTQKSMEAVQGCEKLAYEYGNQEIEQEHLLYSLLTIDDSLILKLVEKMEIHTDYFINVVQKALDARVKVSGGNLRFGTYLNKVLSKIKNKGIRSNEICVCRDRRPRRSKRNGSSKCLFEQNYVRV